MLHIGHQREELGIELEGKKLTQGDSFVYMGGQCVDMERRREREREREVHRRVQAGANAWRAVEWVKAYRRISKIIKAKVMNTFGMPVRNGNFGTDRHTTTTAAGVRKQHFTVYER